jgi:hypothetical protein
MSNVTEHIDPGGPAATDAIAPLAVRGPGTTGVSLSISGGRRRACG